MNGRLPSDAAAARTARAPFARLVLLAVAGALVAACGGGAALSTFGSANDGTTGKGAVEEPPAAATAAPYAAGGADTQRDEWAATDMAAIGAPLIVRTGHLDLEVTDLDPALAAAETAVSAAGGYTAASQRQGDDERSSAMVTYRIPVARWDATLAALRAVGRKVLAEQTASDEVTSQVVDLGARLANLRATEAALQAIMAKATKIPDVLEVQAQLSGVRQEIEQLTAQKQSLEQQAALATLTVGFSLPPAVAVTQVQEGWDPAREADRAAATLVGLGQGLANAAIWIAIVVLPLALVLGACLGLAWLVARRFRRHPAPPARMDAPAA